MISWDKQGVVDKYINKEPGRLIRASLAIRGWKIPQLAAALDYDSKYVHNIIGGHSVSLVAQKRISDCLGYDFWAVKANQPKTRTAKRSQPEVTSNAR